MRVCLSCTFKRFFSTQKKKPQVCIVGSGPAGFYAAQYIVKKINEVQVDIIEKLPVPFGLVRFGVAPDHPDVKNVINSFTKTAQHPNVSYFGNLSLGQDVTFRDLVNCYHVVLLSYGASVNRQLGIPGENLPNVLPARRVVGWYNGFPEDSNLNLDLSGDSVTVFGQGNVAIDVARILLSPVDSLKKTDITQHALESLSSSKVKEVYLVGRRGPLQAAFTIKELREMLKLKDCKTIWREEDFQGVQESMQHLTRPRKRMTELMLKSLGEEKSGFKTVFKPIFYRSPLELIGTANVEKVILGINELVGKDIASKKAVLTNKTEIISTQLAVTSIGYRAVQVDKDIPFNKDKGTIENKFGTVSPGVFAAGWLATGPTGVIISTMNDAYATADSICKYIQNQKVLEGRPGIKGIKINTQIVDWKGWLKIDEFEKNEGKKLGKPREKVIDIKKMLDIAT